MASYTDPPEDGRGRQDLTVAITVLVFSVGILFLPSGAQSRMADFLLGTVLRPFVMTQEALAQARLRAENALLLQAKLDSLASVVASQAPLAEENRTLREALELRDRAPGSFVHANLLRPGTPGSESMFLLDAGSEQGIRPGDPVLMRSGRIGLLGVIREVSPETSVGVDWSHPDFRASAMTSGESVFGLVEPRPGDFPGADRLLLTAIPYHERLDPGTKITTSGLGGVFPRGIPIGEVWELYRDEGGWLSEYWLRPAVETGSATHVLVARADSFAEEAFRMLMEGESPADSSGTASEGGGGS